MMMGGTLEHLDLVQQLCQGEPAQQAEAANMLVHLGSAGMPALLSRFPGPMLAQVPTQGPVPEVAKVGPLLGVLARLRKLAVPFVVPHCDDADLDKRLAATLLLTELVYPEVIDAAVRRLSDDDARIRIVAVEACTRLAAQNPRLTLEKMVLAAKEPRLPPPRRIAIYEVIGSMAVPVAVPLLIPCIADPLAQVGLAARAALVRIARQDFKTDTRKWNGWWSSNVGRHRLEWLMDALLHEDIALQKPAAEELMAISSKNFGYREDAAPRDRELVYARYRDWWQSEGRAQYQGL
jgi:hypothetical protein